MIMIITLDGPAGSGKSTVARLLAERLGFQFLDTGAMYRAVAWKCQQEGVNLDDDEAATQIAMQISLRFDQDRFFCDETEITSEIRRGEISQLASRVAVHPGVRKQLVELQRATAQGQNFVTEGRDQGTVVFPESQCKFFLTASVEARGLRRQADLLEQGEQVDLAELTAEIRERDARDSAREIAPLKPADDALVIDTTEFTQEQVLEQLVEIVQKRQEQ